MTLTGRLRLAAAATAVAVPFALQHHPVAPLLLAVAFLVGASRVYLRVHYPTDVAAGHSLGFPAGSGREVQLRQW